MTVTDEVLHANAQYAAQFNHGDVAVAPARHLAVVTCMDARLHPEAFLGLEIGDAHVIRNAGGRVSDDALRSLIISSHLLGTNEYLVIHHTDCGMVAFTNDTLRQKLAQDTNSNPWDIDFLPFADLEESVRDDVRAIIESPFIAASIPVRGFIYDVKTGRLTEVEGASR
jgi:carbonic anhydrase